jgi:outer membrane receptor protein involved in Fe transport
MDRRRNAWQTGLWAASLLLAALGVPAPCLAQSEAEMGSDQGSDQGSEMLLFMEIPDVVTASKLTQPMDKAPSVMTVWTAHDIEVMGIRSTRELLERTVGFFCNRQYAAPVIGTRGLIADGNEAFLFMIDGHPLNSISQNGASSRFIFPVLYNIARVEVIRGPGSTLWGSDAALGIINFITKSGRDIHGLRIAGDYATEDELHSANFLYGDTLGADSDVAFSFTHMAAYGFPHDGADVYPGDYLSPDYGTSWWGTEGKNYGKIGPIDAIEDSWEFHATMTMGNTKLSAHASDLQGPDLWQRTGDRDKLFFSRRKTSFIELAHHRPIASNHTLEAKLFTDWIYNSPHMYNFLNAPGFDTVTEEDLAREQSYGGELMLNSRLDKDRHDLKLGLRVVRTDVDPIISYSDLSTEENTGAIVPKVIPREEDMVVAYYVEDNWTAIEQLNVIAGLRLDHNNLREKKTAVLPRFGLIWDTSEQITMKYLFNTGYVRPPVNVGFLGGTPIKTDQALDIDYYEIGADKSERIRSHDLQVGYSTAGFQVTTTLYQTELDNYFNYSGQFMTDDGTVTGTPLTEDGKLYRMAIVNANDLKSNGLEIDFRRPMSNTFAWYGNYSFVFHAQVDKFEWETRDFTSTLEGSTLFTADREMTAFPRHSWNVGVNAFLSRDISVNLHLRGWTKMWTRADGTVTPALYAELGPENFLDVNLQVARIAGLPVTASLYAKNVLDNDDSKIAFGPHGGYWSDRARSVGAKIVCEF